MDDDTKTALTAAANRALELEAVQLLEMETGDRFAVVPDVVMLEDLALGIEHPEDRLVIEADDGREVAVFRLLR